MLNKDAVEVLDSTKLKDYLMCPRYFFYAHVVGWRPDSPGLHLKFGEAWHKLQEALLQYGYSEEAVNVGFLKFLEVYREYFSEHLDAANTPKNPAKALEAAYRYVANYGELDRFDEVVYTEISGTVLVANDRVIHFKTDSILKDRRGLYFSREHKTASQNSRIYHDQWHLSVQVGTYTHVLNCLYHPREVKGIEISTSFFYKARPAEFSRHLYTRSPEAMEGWIQLVNHTADSIAEEFSKASQLYEAGYDYPSMPCFWMNPESCTKYAGCPYLSLCMAWQNPLPKLDQVPIGFVKRFWDPREIKTEKVVRL